MNPCNKCGEKSYNNLVFITEMTFGHGDSSHITYVQCKSCGNKTKTFGGYGWHNDEDIRLAQNDWNTKNQIQ